MALVCSAQELPPIINYSADIYSGGNQNWSIAQGDNNFIYVANNDGLLEFDGSKWRLYRSPNGAILRSVSVVNVGSFIFLLTENVIVS